MNITLPWREKRLFVALGEHHIALACVVNGWRNWRVHAQQLVPAPADVSPASLVAVLRPFMVAHGLAAGSAVHWFLPPDILAVAFVPQAMSTLDTQWLPYSPNTVALEAIAGDARFTTALWIHRNWHDVFRHATEQVGGQCLYLHPRALYVQTIARPFHDKNHSASRLKIVHYGQDWHVFHVHHGVLRSVTQAASLTSLQAQARITTEVQQLLDVLQLPASEVLNAEQQLLPSVVCDMAPVLARATGPVPTEWRLSSTQLHACGLLVGRLTGWVERRLQVTVGGLMAVCALGAAAAWQHDQTLQHEQREQAAQLKTLLPVVDEVQQLKATATQQGNILSAQDSVSATAYDPWPTLGRVLAHVPKGAAVKEMSLDHHTLSVELLYASAKGVLTIWTIPDAPHPPLTQVPDVGGPEGQGVRVRYTTSLSPDQTASAPSSLSSSASKTP